MGLLFQWEGWLPPALRSDGCAALSRAAIPQLYHHAFLPPEATLNVLNDLKDRHVLGMNYNIANERTPGQLLRAITQAIGYDTYGGAEVGQHTAMGTWYYPNVHFPRWNYAVADGRLLNGGPHQVLCDWELRVIYNPKPGRDLVAVTRYILYWYGPLDTVKSLYE